MMSLTSFHPLSVFILHFSFCCSAWLLSITLSSRLPVRSSASQVLNSSSRTGSFLYSVHLFRKDLINLWERQRQRDRHRQREKQAPFGEPDAGLHPRPLGSRPEPKGDAQPLSHPGVPLSSNFIEGLTATTWMDLEGIMLSEVSQIKTDTIWFHLCVEF